MTREEDLSEEELDQLEYLKKLVGSRGGDINDFDQEYVEPTAAENYGYINKPGYMSFLGMAPVPGAGMASMALNTGINLGNNQAIRTAQKMLGIPSPKPNFVKDMVKSPKDGFIGDIPIKGKNYPVGFEAKNKEGETTLTPNEARMRSLVGGPQPSVPDGVKHAGKEEDQMDDGTDSLHAGLGLASTPDGFRHIDDPDLPARNMADVNYDLEGRGRNQIPSSGIGDKVSDVVTDMLGAGYTVNVTSGQEPEGRSPVGSQYRHPLGFAADLDIRDPDGRKLSLDNPEDKAAIESVAQGMAARYNANFGMGPEYMGNNTMHIDTMDLNKYGNGKAGPQWASVGKEWADVLDNARATGVMPAQYYDINNPPVPGQRPEEPSYAIAEADDPVQTQTQTDTPLGFMGRQPPTEKKSESLPSYDSLMNSTQTQNTGVTVNPDRFKDITDEQKELMGMTLAGEIDPGRTDLTTEAGRREAMGILSTIENRAPKYGGITEAITAPNQYSTWNNQAASNTASTNYHGNKSTYDTLVSDFMSNPANNLGFTSYHADTVNPGWSDQMQNKEQIGPHTFGFLDEYSKPAGAFNGPAPHTVFNTTASYAPHMSGMVSEVNVKTPSQSQLASTASSKPSTTKETSSGSGFSSMGGVSGSGGSSMGSGGSGMTGTSGNPGKDKDDKISSSGFSGGRSY